MGGVGMVRTVVREGIIVCAAAAPCFCREPGRAMHGLRLTTRSHLMGRQAGQNRLVSIPGMRVEILQGELGIKTRSRNKTT